MLLGELKLGRVDGKHEFVARQAPDASFFDTFLMPENVPISDIEEGNIFFIKGFRGTGKTSLLRYFVFSQDIPKENRKLILFKTGLSEEEKLEISQQVGIKWDDVDSRKMEVSQNFKQAWIWRIFHEIGTILRERPQGANRNAANFLKILGLQGESPFDKIMGFLPKIDGVHINLRGNVGFFEGQLGADLQKKGNEARTTLQALNRALKAELVRVSLNEKIIIAFDELEAFFETEERYHRDLRMVRDIIFATSEFNEYCRAHCIPVYIYAAIRTEILDAMRVVGHEVEREAHDFGVTLAWHYAPRSIDHPLLNLVRKKITANFLNKQNDEDILFKFFPKRVQSEPLDKYLLDGSFYKPRDLMWRLTIAQKNFPKKKKFDGEVLTRTRSEYSSELWKEVEYELSAAYNKEEIAAITMLFSGIAQYFSLEDMEKRAEVKAKQAERVRKLMQRKSMGDILTDLYRLGAIGNAFRAAPRSGAIRNRWIFRGDSDLLLDRRMQLHPALIERLSGVRGQGMR